MDSQKKKKIPNQNPNYQYVSADWSKSSNGKAN